MAEQESGVDVEESGTRQQCDGWRVCDNRSKIMLAGCGIKAAELYYRGLERRRENYLARVWNKGWSINVPRSGIKAAELSYQGLG